ncbi:MULTISPECIES: GFA family protein [Streptomyces violaceusniger group]
MNATAAAGAQGAEDTEERTGGCLCGRIRFTTRGPAVFPHTCACEHCQKLGGAPRRHQRHRPCPHSRVLPRQRRALAAPGAGDRAQRSRLTARPLVGDFTDTLGGCSTRTTSETRWATSWRHLGRRHLTRKGERPLSFENKRCFEGSG